MSDFENVNNAVVRAAPLGGEWATLNEDFQNRVAGQRAWMQLVPPLWASTLESYWVRYAKLYAANPAVQGKITSPRDIVPGGLTAAVKELYAPVTDTVTQSVQAMQAKAEAKLKTIEDAVNAKLSSVAQKAGAEIAKGVQQETYNWAWALGGVAVGAGILWLLFKYSGGNKALGELGGPLTKQRVLRQLRDGPKGLKELFTLAEQGESRSEIRDALRVLSRDSLVENSGGRWRLSEHYKAQHGFDGVPGRRGKKKELGFWIRKYGINTAEAAKLVKRPEIVEQHEEWRERNGLPEASSPLSRGHLLDMLKGHGKGLGSLPKPRFKVGSVVAAQRVTKVPDPDRPGKFLHVFQGRAGDVVEVQKVGRGKNAARRYTVKWRDLGPSYPEATGYYDEDAIEASSGDESAATVH